MRILFVTNNLPYPPTDGWKMRVWALIRHLRARHQVTVASFMRTTEDPGAVTALRAHCEAVHVIPREPRYSPWKLLQGAAGPLPFSIVNFADPRMRTLVNDLFARGSFDVIQAESLHMAQYCLGAAAMTVLDLHNIESMLMKRYAAQARHPLKRVYAELTWRKLLRYERRIYGAFDQCLTCSEEDRRLALVESPAARVAVIPNGVEVAEYLPDESGARPDRLVFVGRMDYHANVDGAEWLCRDILPRVRAYRPDVRLTIVGAHPTRRVQRLAQPGVVEVTGFVEDVRPYLREAAVVVIPLRVGGGTRLKLLEAMAGGKAVVSTTVGAEGIEVTHGRDILLADRPDDFSMRILALMTDAALRRRIATAARELAGSRYDWNGIVRGLEGVYERRNASLTGRIASPVGTEAARALVGRLEG